MSGDDNDDALWDAVKKTVRPMQRPREAEKPAKSAKALPRQAKPKSVSSVTIASAPKPAPLLPSLTSLHRREKTRIARGSVEIEGKLDLHGYKLGPARDRLAAFLERAQDSGKSLVLVITGKGTTAAKGMERGVLKREVPLWLGSPQFRALVIGFEEAASRHGGAGALYVRVRRKR